MKLLQYLGRHVKSLSVKGSKDFHICTPSMGVCRTQYIFKWLRLRHHLKAQHEIQSLICGLNDKEITTRQFKNMRTRQDMAATCTRQDWKLQKKSSSSLKIDGAIDASFSLWDRTCSLNFQVMIVTQIQWSLLQTVVFTGETKRFVNRTFYQILVGWANEGGRDGLGVWQRWKRWVMHTKQKTWREEIKE
jgi:hypothetical protein